MDLAAAVAGIEQHLTQFAESAKEKLGQELPVLADVASKVAADPFVQFALSTVLSPAGKQMVTELASKLVALEQAAEASKQQAAADAAEQARQEAAAAAAAPSEPDTPVNADADAPAA